MSNLKPGQYPLKPGRINVPVIILGTVDIDKIGMIRRVTSASSQRVIVDKVEKTIQNGFLAQLVP
jgi:hypothetical protein